MKKFTKAAKDLKKIVVDGAAEFSAKSSTGLPNSKISSTILRNGPERRSAASEILHKG
jgi:hypothetical protein